MAIEYSFLDRGPEALIEASEMPAEGGIAIAVRTTGYEVGTDEAVQVFIADLDGRELFCQTVKPQNVEVWDDLTASGGLTPADVADAPELFQFEDEVCGLFEGAQVVVGMHMGFIHEVLETSWISLPSVREVDLATMFCSSHSARDYPGQPAAVAALPDIAGYYGVACAADEAGEARTVAACYRALVAEHARERDAKSPAYWDRYRRETEEAERNDAQLQESKRIQQVKTLRVNAILWLCAAAIFGNLAVQMHLRAVDTGFVVVAAAAGVYFAARWIMCLYRMYTLRKRD